MNMQQYSSTEAASANTTFVQADPSTFRTIVQQLTGASDHHHHHPTSASSSAPPPKQQLPLTHSAAARPVAPDANIGPKKHVFKLHERRQAMKKLEIKLNNNNNHHINILNSIGKNGCPSSDFSISRRQRAGFLVSPVSTLDLWSRGASETDTDTETDSARCLNQQAEEQERAVIAEKGFYLHPSPRGGGGAQAQPPELLPLFPLHSPS